jgi:hypothetical protein
MSWQEAKSEAERIYAELRAKHDHGFAKMVIDALQREHARDRPRKVPPETSQISGRDQGPSGPR